MIKQKTLVIALPILAIVGASIGIYIDRMNAINFSANGVVTKAAWNTSNHNMSLFVILNQETNERKRLQDSRVILQPKDIKVGDRFVKKSGSKLCLINDIEITCID